MLTDKYAHEIAVKLRRGQPTDVPYPIKHVVGAVTTHGGTADQDLKRIHAWALARGDEYARRYYLEKRNHVRLAKRIGLLDRWGRLTKLARQLIANRWNNGGDYDR